MDESGKKRKSFIVYEYKEFITESNKVSFLIDGYKSFGWEIDENISRRVENINYSNKTKVIIHLKRKCKIINKMELTRLQRNFEACVNEIEELEKSKTSVANMYAIICGFMGTVFIAGSVFAVTAEIPHIVFSILLAVPGFLGWIFPMFIYKKVVEKHTKKLIPLIEEKYDEIYKICEKGNKLLY